MNVGDGAFVWADDGTDLRLPDAIDLDRSGVVVVVVVDGLAEECDFDDTVIGELLALVHNVVGVAVDFGPASVGYDAVGTEFVAAARDADVCGLARPGKVLARQ